MKNNLWCSLTVLAVVSCVAVGGGCISIPAEAPLVQGTSPADLETGVDPNLTEISVTYNQDMRAGNYSWVKTGIDPFPELLGQPRFLDDRTCVVQVELKPDTHYVIWLNNEEFNNFKNRQGVPAHPYKLEFTTGPQQP